MDVAVVAAVALLASGLTLFSGFGLGTLLLPAFLFFFPADLAVAMTAIVHFLNNLFKFLLLGRHASRSVVLRFGVPAIIAAIAGSGMLVMVTDAEPLLTYSAMGKDIAVMPVKLLMGVMIGVFAILEILPALDKLELDTKFLPVGGLLSGFFGGLSGHQGALRSAFLVRAGLASKAFIATGVVIACLVDVTRLAVYARHIVLDGIQHNVSLLVVATLSAFLGVFIGSRLVTKVTMREIQMIVTVMLLIVAALLIFGII